MICVSTPPTFAELCEQDARTIRLRMKHHIPASPEAIKPLSLYELHRLSQHRWEMVFQEESAAWCRLPRMADLPGPALRAEGWEPS